jgi:hypothetical protein
MRSSRFDIFYSGIKVLFKTTGPNRKRQANQGTQRLSEKPYTLGDFLKGGESIPTHARLSGITFARNHLA